MPWRNHCAMSIAIQPPLCTVRLLHLGMLWLTVLWEEAGLSDCSSGFSAKLINLGLLLTLSLWRYRVADRLLVQAKPEYSKKEKKSCTFCHIASGKKELNPAGGYYKEKHTLEGYTPKP